METAVIFVKLTGAIISLSAEQVNDSLTNIDWDNNFLTKLLSLLLTKLLTAIRESLQRYCSTAYSISSVNQTWILKNFEELLENLVLRFF
jgi:hypothetical protein